MNAIQTFAIAAAAGLALSFAAGPTVASERSARIISAPAVAAPATAATGEEGVITAPIVAPVDGPITTTSVVIVTPIPLPALPPNACRRGNSSGVSRCPR